VVTVGGPYLDTWRYSNTVVDSSAQVSFHGRQVKLIYLAGPDLGSADVYVDGVKVGTLDESDPAWLWQSEWTSGLFPEGDHSLRILYTTGSMFDIDALTVLPQ
jgi:hypothetical protein